jgi:Leucine-rich repeat (LRR) protein
MTAYTVKSRSMWFIGALILSFLRVHPATELTKSNVDQVCLISDQELYIYCSGKSITSIEPTLFSEFYYYTDLDLSSNQITSIDAATFDSLGELRSLNLGYNKISSLNVASFSHMKSLETLNLIGNKLTSIEPGTFANLTNLQKLILNSNQLKVIQPNTFVGLDHLQYLELNSNRIETLPALALKGLESLATLDLSNNRINSISGLVLDELQAPLESLSLRGNKLNVSDVPDLFCLKLERIDLCENQFRRGGETDHEQGFVSEENCDRLEELREIWETRYALKRESCHEEALREIVLSTSTTTTTTTSTTTTTT